MIIIVNSWAEKEKKKGQGKGGVNKTLKGNAPINPSTQTKSTLENGSFTEKNSIKIILKKKKIFKK